MRAPWMIVALALGWGGQLWAGQQSQAVVGGEEEPGFDAVPVVLVSQGLEGYLCTGSLIAPKVVLTAAHCVAPLLQGGSGSVSFGPSVTDAFETRDIVDQWIHPDYSGLIANDIGMVYLDRAAGPRPLPMKLDAIDLDSAAGRPALDVGFGITGDNQNDSGIKRSVWLDIYDVSPAAVLVNSSGTGACHGDSGGPLFVREGEDLIVWGVAATVLGSCGAALGTFTRVDVHGALLLDGIEAIHGTRDPCEASGFYQDGACDLLCPEPDPDCAPQEGCACHQQNSPAGFSWRLLLLLAGAWGLQRRPRAKAQPLPGPGPRA